AGCRPYLGLDKSRFLSHDLARWLVGADAKKSGMPKLAVRRPFYEAHLHDNLGARPMHTQARKSYGPGRRERQFRGLEQIQPLAQGQQPARVEARTNLSSKYQVIVLVIPDEQRTQTD